MTAVAMTSSSTTVNAVTAADIMVFLLQKKTFVFLPLLPLVEKVSVPMTPHSTQWRTHDDT